MIFLFFITSVLAQSLKLSEVHETVKKRMPLIIEAQEKIRAQEGQLQSQMGAFDTKLKFKSMNQIEDKYDNQVFEAKLEKQTPWMGSRLYLGHRQGTGVFASYDGKYETSSLGELFAGVDVPLLRDREIDEFRLARIQAQLDLSRQKVLWKQKNLEVLFKSSEVYWKWVMAGRKWKVLTGWLEKAQSRQKFLEKKVSAGDTSAIKLTDNRRTLLKREADLKKAERDYQQARLELSLYLNRMPKLEELPLTIELSEDVTSIPHEKERNILPPFALIEIENELLSQERTFAISQQLPDLRLAVEGARDVGYVPSSQGGQDQLRVGVMIDIPLENRKGKGKREEVAGKTSALSYRRRWLEQEWQARIKQNAIALTTTREQLTIQRSEVADTSRMAQAELTRFNQGDSDIFFVNIREQDEAESMVRLIETESLHEVMAAERRLLDGQWAKEI